MEPGDPSTDLALYHSDWGVPGFQAEGSAKLYLLRDGLLVWATGIGKSHVAMQTMALLFEDDLIDYAIVCCEKNKIDEWGSDDDHEPGDLKQYTGLSHYIYHGPKRQQVVAGELPRVLVSTYETLRSDLVQIETTVLKSGKKSKKLVLSPLGERYRGKRVLVVYDESTKLAKRTSKTYKAHHLFVTALRKACEVRGLGMTATPVEADLEDVFNQARIVIPYRVGTVASFELEHVRGRDIFGRPTGFKNVRVSEQPNPDGTMPVSFYDKLGPHLLVKTEDDPDVREQYPSLIEEFRSVPIVGAHRDFYETVLDTFLDREDVQERTLFGVLRQISAHPMSMSCSHSKIAQEIHAEVGTDGLRALGSDRCKYLIEYLEPLVNGQGAQVVIFEYYGQTVLPFLQEELVKHFASDVHHGAMSNPDREDVKRRFREGQVRVLLSSHAGKRGINLPQAQYAIHHSPPLTYADYIQPIGRVRRINSEHETVFSRLLWAPDTVEEGVMGLVLKRNKWHDLLTLEQPMGDEVAGGDEDEMPALTAESRRRMLTISKKAARRAA